MRSEQRFYVYVLIDPRDGGHAFYVGKGSGGRVHQHAKMVARGRHPNTYLSDRCREIVDAGHSVNHQIVWDKLLESDAYRRERLLIEAIGSYRLVNDRVSSNAWAFNQMARAKKILKNLHPLFPAEWREHIVGMTEGRYLVPNEYIDLAGVKRLEAFWDGSWLTGKSHA